MTTARPRGPGAAAQLQWRVTTATRVFALAIAVGGVLAEGSLGRAAPVISILGLTVLVTSVLDVGSLTALTRWIPVVEGLLATLVLMLAEASPSTLVYLAVPPVVAGVRSGLVTAVNTASISVVAGIGAVMPAGAPRISALPEAITWQLTGLGFGVLAALLLRDIRRRESRQAPYAEAHRHIAQLFGLARDGQVGLDSSRLADELNAALRSASGATACGIVIHRGASLIEVISRHGKPEELLSRWQAVTTGTVDPEVLCVPIHGDDGAVQCTALLVRPGRWAGYEVQEVERVTASRVLPLGTALLFDELRLIGIAEERHRLARELHDGVAQELTGLGYLVDEIEAVSEGETTLLVAGLRTELSRVIGEFRFSIFDLRSHARDQRVSEALAEYAREASRGRELQVHLTLQESTPPMSKTQAAELLKIAREAVSNARRHAGATNLWIRLVWDGANLDFSVEDDGRGRAAPRPRHWGIQTMGERAASIGAEFAIVPRPGGGTSVSVKTASSPPGLAS